ncbi:hypothetical protein BDD14_4692 [Edaphobacter modestus]|uniref:Uncharacterized protein n=1 Tax=Edaphobacter modestus TaxID=388466 RepID=A0A4Q7YZV2_9BACT|nr:hypothetical protein BDD14_4692 [Edaphobacter modestus]
MSESEMQAELERLRAENAQLKSKDKGGLTLKVSANGGLSLYGMGRFPVTLYKEQWLRILASAPGIEAHIGRHHDRYRRTRGLDRLQLRVLLFQFFQPLRLVYLQPPILLRQRKYVCSTISASLHACAVLSPFATATSVCRSRFTTCSG